MSPTVQSITGRPREIRRYMRARSRTEACWTAGRLEHRQLVSLLPFGEPIAVCRGHPFAYAAFAIRDVGLPSTEPLGCRELRDRHSPALKQHGGPDHDSDGDERCDGGSDNRPEATTARKGRVGARVDLPWVGRRGTLPTACGELCLRRGSSVVKPTLSVLKLGVRTRPKCQD